MGLWARHRRHEDSLHQRCRLSPCLFCFPGSPNAPSAEPTALCQSCLPLFRKHCVGLIQSRQSCSQVPIRQSRRSVAGKHLRVGAHEGCCAGTRVCGSGTGVVIVSVARANGGGRRPPRSLFSGDGIAGQRAISQLVLRTSLARRVAVRWVRDEEELRSISHLVLRTSLARRGRGPVGPRPGWCPGQDSNLHALRQGLLRP